MLDLVARGNGRWSPRVVCLCGSTRFWRAFQQNAQEQTLLGRIVLSIGSMTGTDDEHFAQMDDEERVRVKHDLDTLHKYKIDLADEVLILNVDDYVGESTASELAYARARGKRVVWLLRSVYRHTGEGHLYSSQNSDWAGAAEKRGAPTREAHENA